MKNTLRATLALAATLLASTTPAWSKDKPRDCLAEMGPLPAQVKGIASAIDGDTLAITGLKPHIRLWGIQAPELRNRATTEETVPGMRARAHLAELIAGDNEPIVCRPVKYERYCRILAFCDGRPLWGDTPGERADLSESMLDHGYAYGAWLDDPAPGQPQLGQNYAALERGARREKRGLWREWRGEK